MDIDDEFECDDVLVNEANYFRKILEAEGRGEEVRKTIEAVGPHPELYGEIFRIMVNG